MKLLYIEIDSNIYYNDSLVTTADTLKTNIINSLNTYSKDFLIPNEITYSVENNKKTSSASCIELIVNLLVVDYLLLKA